MKRKIFLLLTFFCIALALLISCGDGETADSSNSSAAPTSSTSVCTKHTYGDWTETKAPSCLENGAKEQTCTVCGFVNTDVVDALGHTPSNAGNKEPTCTEEGYENKIICSVCNEVIYEGTPVPSAGHNYRYGYCSVCGSENPLNDLRILIYTKLGDDSYDLLSTVLDSIDLSYTVSFIDSDQATAPSGYDIYIFNNVVPETVPTDGALWFINPDTLPDQYGKISDEYVENSDGFELSFLSDSFVASAINKGALKDGLSLGAYRPITDLAEGLYPFIKANNEGVSFAGNVNGIPVIIFSFHFYSSELPLDVDLFPIFINNMALYSYENMSEEESKSCTHERATIKTIEPTCVSPGLSKGIYCSKCGKILIPQEVVEATGKHDLDENGQCKNCEYKEEAEAPSSTVSCYTIVVDLSSSMKELIGDKTKFSITLDSLRQVIMLDEKSGGLKDTDYIGIVCFDGASHTALEATLLGDSEIRAQTWEKIEYELLHYFYAYYIDSNGNETSIPVCESDGDTYTSQGYTIPAGCDGGNVDLVTGQYIKSYGSSFKQPILDASSVISDLETQVTLGNKQIILIADGAPNDVGSGYIGSVEFLNRIGVTTSTVSIGEVDSGNIEEIKAVATAGGGTFGQAATAEELLTSLYAILGLSE